MRAIGATPTETARLVIAEAFAISAISFSIALVLAGGLSFYMGRLIGIMAFKTPLPLTISGATGASRPPHDSS